MRGPTVTVFVLILATAGLLATVWEFQLKEPLLGHVPEPFAQKLENVGVSATLVAVSLIIPLWLLGGADEDRQELIDSLRSAAKVFEHSADGIMIADREGMVLAVNPAFTQITGYRGRDAVDRNLWMLLLDEQEAEFAKLMWTSVQGSGDWTDEILIQRKGGERISVIYTLSVVRTEAGGAAGYVAMLALPVGKHRPDEMASVRAQDDSAAGSQSAAT